MLERLFSLSKGGFSGSIRGTIDNVRGCLDAVGAVPVRSGNAEN